MHERLAKLKQNPPAYLVFLKKRRIYTEKWRATNREKTRKYCKKYKASHPDRVMMDRIDRQRRTRLKAVTYIGEPKCARCGYTDLRALVIDHRNNDGNKERQGSIGKRGVCYFLKILRMPQEEAKSRYQILCANCNMIKENEQRNIKIQSKLVNIQAKDGTVWNRLSALPQTITNHIKDN